MCVARFPKTCRSRLEVGARLAAALGRGFSERGNHESLFLEPLQRGINACESDFTAAFFRDLTRDEDAIGIFGWAYHGKQNHEFQLTKIFALSHIFHNNEVIGKAQHKTMRRIAVRTYR